MLLFILVYCYFYININSYQHIDKWIGDKMLINKIILIIFILLNLLSINVYANNLKCNNNQKICVIEDKTLIIGDKVGIYNKNNKIAALGTVTKMKDKYRYITIYKKYKTINIGSYVKRLDDKDFNAIEQSFSNKKQNNTEKYGGSFSIGNIDLGEGGMSFGLEGTYLKEYTQYKEVHLEGAGLFLISFGKRQDPEDNYTKYNYAIYTLGCTGNVLLWFLKEKLINPYIHMGLGLAYSSRSDSKSSFVLTPSMNIRSGLGLILRAGGGIIIDHPKLGWYPKLIFDIYKIQSSIIFNLSFGILMNIK